MVSCLIFYVKSVSATVGLAGSFSAALERLADLLLGWLAAILYRSFDIGLVRVFSAVRISISILVGCYNLAVTLDSFDFQFSDYIIGGYNGVKIKGYIGYVLIIVGCIGQGVKLNIKCNTNFLGC